MPERFQKRGKEDLAGVVEPDAEGRGQKKKGERLQVGQIASGEPYTGSSPRNGDRKSRNFRKDKEGGDGRKGKFSDGTNGGVVTQVIRFAG